MKLTATEALVGRKGTRLEAGVLTPLYPLVSQPPQRAMASDVSVFRATQREFGLGEKILPPFFPVRTFYINQQQC